MITQSTESHILKTQTHHHTKTHNYIIATNPPINIITYNFSSNLTLSEHKEFKQVSVNLNNSLALVVVVFAKASVTITNEKSHLKKISRATHLRTKYPLNVVVELF